MSSWAGEVRQAVGESVVLDAPFGGLTTYRTGGKAAALVVVDSVATLERLAEALAKVEVPNLFVLGNGSNTLVSDEGFNGLVVKIGGSVNSEPKQVIGGVKVGGGASLPTLSRRLASLGLTGFEWAVGVPGTVGGAAKMNAGGHGSEFVECFVSATVLDLSSGVFYDRQRSLMEFGYRTSSVGNAELVWEVHLGLHEGSSEESQKKIAEIVAWRRANQPGGQNAGSVFRNPVGKSAGYLIDEAGLKGFAVGGASISEKHANFIQATKGASSSDVLALMSAVRRRIFLQTGQLLESEVVLVGFDESSLGDWRKSYMS